MCEFFSDDFPVVGAIGDGAITIPIDDVLDRL